MVHKSILDGFRTLGTATCGRFSSLADDLPDLRKALSEMFNVDKEHGPLHQLEASKLVEVWSQAKALESCSACWSLPACSWSWVSSPPREGAEWLPVVLPFLVSSLVFSDEAFVLLFSSGLRLSLGSLFVLILVDFPTVYVVGPFFFCGISELRGARQVERFVACSFRHLPQVVFHPGGQPRSFSDIPGETL